ncbi:hypothetical protein M441DRAFT_143077 [Trichoderma asperellum CBS 433.97]|uniref:ABC transporter domain-containing protein n=1 Tax=Trichoderma asperellum (strain ATCC 204424 / CBS 433.97 / NBRC 101777) TaxID=1042311 RepID=A0A2T3Z6K2_TRIA4|nr:hypothetical protein M441DRAFT_143077 [Trichoderma asperellum CBS 433.97]PTB40380.1 hypothetical protein M441DRAFT_143077 [Trichoderma asperellum CBS 433.97]WVH32637.1 ABC transporter protein [Trichoderma asperellum]
MFEGYCSTTLKERLFAHVMRQSGDFHDNKELDGLNGGLDLHFLIKMIIDMISTAIDLTLAAGYLTAILGPHTTVIIFVILALYTFISQKLFLAELYIQNSAVLNEFRIRSAAINLWRTVAYNNGIQFEIERYLSTVREALKIQTKKAYRSNVESLQMGLISSGAKALAQYCMVYQIIQGRASPSDFIIFISYWDKVNNSFTWLFRTIKHVPNSFSRIKWLTIALRHTPAVPHRPNAKRLEKCDGQIEFENVSFGFGDAKLILDDVSFSVKPGEFVAIVGRTGAGKSTIFNLLTLLYPPRNGSVYIDNHNIHDSAVDDVRKYIAIVPQSPELFPGSIMYNLKYANNQASDGDVRKICEMVGLDKEITESMGGYDAQVGQRGEKLSGGQRQRMALAKASLKSAPIVLLDEPFSSLDADTSKKIRDHNLWHRATCLMITHKLSEVKGASRIIVLDNGKIVENDSHERLMNKRGRYYELWLAQSDEIPRARDCLG